MPSMMLKRCQRLLMDAGLLYFVMLFEESVFHVARDAVSRNVGLWWSNMLSVLLQVIKSSRLPPIGGMSLNTSTQVLDFCTDSTYLYFTLVFPFKNFLLLLHYISETDNILFTPLHLSDNLLYKLQFFISYHLSPDVLT